MTSKSYFEILTEIYQKYNPEKVRDIPLLLEKYRGQEEALIAIIKEKYCGQTVPVQKIYHEDTLDKEYPLRPYKRSLAKRVIPFVIALAIVLVLLAGINWLIVNTSHREISNPLDENSLSSANTEHKNKIVPAKPEIKGAIILFSI